MEVRHRVTAILFLTWCVFFAIGCDNVEVAIYEVKLTTFWNEDSYGKMQWSPIFGQSHNRSYLLYRAGEIPRQSVQTLIQFGGIDDLMLEGEEDPTVYDQFSTPAISSGVGQSKGLVVVDGGHSLVSLISRMMPSSNWFVGVDGVDLCVDSSWVDQITLDLEPLTSGASRMDYFEDDHPSQSAGPVIKLGTRAIGNRLSGFLYPARRELPTTVKAEFTKKETYSTEKINKLVRSDVLSKLKQKKAHKNELTTKMDEDIFQELTTKNYVEHLMELEEEPFGTPSPNQPENTVVVVTRAPQSYFRSSNDRTDEEPMSMDDAVLAVARGRHLGLKKHLPRHFRSRLHHAVNHRPHKK